MRFLTGLTDRTGSKSYSPSGYAHMAQEALRGYSGTLAYNLFPTIF